MPVNHNKIAQRFGLAASVLALAVASPALAQDEAAGEREQDSVASDDTRRDRNDRIVVTGSRVPRSTFDTPNPVTVVDAEC
ncbi:hypothetical protein [Aurantiacibacter xanthus]|uniref:hypothetical protein n=1 Tax=Aurantiacibacter xanthus TaxID=1784712 RepID=UPI0011C23EC7|nr:hypothetical protein [Aurantiacibacter xanthus]